MAAYISFQPSDYFSTLLYTGTGSSLGVTGVGFQPDFIWIKHRDGTSNHYLADAARGAGKYVESSTAIAQVDNINGLSAFDADGFTVGTQGAQVNGSSDTYVSWNWKGGTTSGITTDGSTTITPSAYSFNQTSGFSALAYSGNSTSGAKLAHGLGATPEMVLVKNLQTTNNWSVYHKDMETSSPEDWQIQLDTDSASTNNAGMWNDTAPDSVNLTLGNDNGTNGSYNMVAYCFTGKKGYSKFGYYYGNGNADGTFVHTGFRPAFILIKRNHATGNWQIFDDKRLGYNGGNSYLSPNDTAVENTGGQIDILSNGFKMRNTGTYTNASLSTYIYAAFAEFPFVSSNSKATVAR